MRTSDQIIADILKEIDYGWYRIVRMEVKRREREFGLDDKKAKIFRTIWNLNPKKNEEIIDRKYSALAEEMKYFVYESSKKVEALYGVFYKPIQRITHQKSLETNKS